MPHSMNRREYRSDSKGAKSRGAKSKVRQARRRNRAAKARTSNSTSPRSRRSLAMRNLALPFSPPEDWHEPTEGADSYSILYQEPGNGYRHVVTPDEIRNRLESLPAEFLRDLEVVQLSRMTRKKKSLPCYGMQWGPSLYLYPLDESLSEYFYAPPAPSVLTETRMYGGRWREEPGVWILDWTESTIRDFYLNNILIHELGHLLDERNTSYVDRERFAEWFATEYGYRSTGGAQVRRPRQSIKRRHHAF